MNIQGFYTGREFDADTFFGAHPYEGGTHFAVWAPSARDVKVITSGLSDGSWAEWQMHRSYSGCWEADAAGVTRGTCYQYRVCGADGSVVDHCDPYGTAMTLRPDGRSIVWGAPTCQWTDSAWMAKRSKNFDAPLNIYEAQAGSWRCKEDGTPYTYSELAKQLPAYLKENGYTHLELMPLSEYPFDGSWGYQTTGFFAPTSRYGTPDELCTLIDACHAADIGVIFDFVPVHFAVDEYGLKRFDGTALYEYPAAAVGESEWGSCNFMHSRGEIRCFLQSAADYWLRTFHADGLRMDAVSRLIYWQGDPCLLYTSLCGGWCVCIAGCCCTGQVGAGACRGGGTCKGGCQYGNQPVGLLCLRRSGGKAVPVHQGGGAGQCCSPVGCGMAGKTKEVSVCCAAHDCGFGGPTAGLRR